MFVLQDGVCSPEDVDTVMSKGLGLRYSFMGPFETMHMNAGGQWISRHFRAVDDGQLERC
jgi:3-hydroxyacyl-CoA dehydrogenase